MRLWRLPVGFVLFAVTAGFILGGAEGAEKSWWIKGALLGDGALALGFMIHGLRITRD